MSKRCECVTVFPRELICRPMCILVECENVPFSLFQEFANFVDLFELKSNNHFQYYTNLKECKITNNLHKNNFLLMIYYNINFTPSMIWLPKV